ncbi:hypothetical protein [Actinokineospora sp. NPDC004072]
MATPEEIRQRVEEADSVRSARRAAAAQRVGELARRRAAIVAQLAEVDRELADVVADAQDVIGVEELAAFTDLKSSDLTEWTAGRQPGRGKRKKTATGASGGARFHSGPTSSLSERPISGEGSTTVRRDKSVPPVAHAS